jgi:hypothetical protein
MVHGVVVCELGQWEKLNPVILLVFAKGSEVLLHRLILPLRLAIRLWVEGCRESVVSTDMGTYPRSESARKLASSISDHVVGHTMLTNDMLEEESGQFQ